MATWHFKLMPKISYLEEFQFEGAPNETTFISIYEDLGHRKFRVYLVKIKYIDINFGGIGYLTICNCSCSLYPN